jgi:hypothetical protein
MNFIQICRLKSKQTSINVPIYKINIDKYFNYSYVVNFLTIYS